MSKDTSIHKAVCVRSLLVFIICISIFGCGSDTELIITPDIPLPKNTETSEPDATDGSFTYVTQSGAIWQVNVNGQKKEILSSDNIPKRLLRWTPDHQRLAYIAQILAPDGVSIVGKKLMVLQTNTSDVTELTESAAEILYAWRNNDEIDLKISYELSDGSGPPEWEDFLLDVNNGERTPSIVEHIPLRSDYSSVNERLDFSFEVIDDKRLAYLTDKNGNILDKIYKKPIDDSWPLKWSPDSQNLLYYSSSGKSDIFLYNVNTKENLQITELIEQGDDQTSIIQTSWSPNNNVILVRLATQTTYEQPCIVYISQNQVQCFELSSKSGQFVWSRNGDYLAFIGPAGAEPPDIYAIDIAKKELLNLTMDGNEMQEVKIALE